MKWSKKKEEQCKIEGLLSEVTTCMDCVRKFSWHFLASERVICLEKQFELLAFALMSTGQVQQPIQIQTDIIYTTNKLC